MIVKNPDGTYSTTEQKFDHPNYPCPMHGVACEDAFAIHARRVGATIRRKESKPDEES